MPPNLLLTRRHALVGAASLSAAVATAASAAPQPRPRVRTGAMIAADNSFASLQGARIGFVTNQTGRIGAEHLVDRLRRTPGLKLTSILAPEHGFRGQAEAGAKVQDSRDPATGLPVHSLYGATRKPTPAMLRDVDVLVFDIQDVGVRFYTYISTMGYAMQAAAERGIPFIVLDRPNPIGGVDVSGFVLERARASFVGLYPIPIVHGMSVGELARMIQGEGWLSGLDKLTLRVEKLGEWRRDQRWHRTGLPWVATSPNVPTFDTALAYPGIGMVGECLVNEGRGTPTPFRQFGAPWLDAPAMAAALTRAGLPGVRFEAIRYTPRGIPNVAANPRFESREIPGVRLHFTDRDAFKPLDTGLHAMAALNAQARAKGEALLPSTAMFAAIAGTGRLQALLDRGASGAEIAASWREEAARFAAVRKSYLMYA